MNEQNNIYYQQKPMMPPPPIWQRVRTKASEMKDAFPKWLTQYSVVVYLLSLAIVSFIYSAYSLPWYYLLSGLVAVLVFFLYGNTLLQKTSIVKMRKERTFEKRLLIYALIPRVLFTLLIYWIFQENYGNEFGFENGDADYYQKQALEFANAMRSGTFITTWNRVSKYIDISDLGYSAYIGFIYWLTGDSIMIVRLIKCLLSAITVLLIYRIAKRNFDEPTARIAAVFCALWPNFWYYCGVHLKETEMVFLGVLFVEQADQMLRSRQFTAWKVIPVLLIAAAIFTVRTPLGLVALLALIFSVVMSSARVVSWGKRVVVGVLAIILIAVTMGNRIQEQTQSLLETAQSQDQRSNMEWRATRDNGNAFAKYAGSAIFAPMIFTLPFPTMASVEGQDVQQLLNGGNFVKNIMSFFVLVAMFALLLSGEWRQHLLPLSFMLGYLVVLSLSNFAQSERFHQPALPFELMFAAYGLNIAVTKKKYKRWFTYWCGLMFVVCVAWNWFKLAGRGLA
ncbi:MAG: glycosyltransferase family 39 protein [Paludibacteraceae bacterium]|nr:glycosyltransferase family 39 protein [Paludibacteraceae bacterium]